MTETVDGLFAQLAARQGGAPHLLFADGSSNTYGQTYQLARRLAAVMVDAGIQPGDRVACFMGNCRPLYHFFIACGLAGAVAVPINTQSRAREILGLCADCGPKGIVAQASLLEALDGQELPDEVGLRLILGEHGLPTPAGWADYDGALAVLGEAEVDSRGRPDQAAMIIYSSGTTGQPKGIVLGHRQLLRNARLTSAVLGYRADDRFLTLLPSFHLFGYSFDFLYAALAGAQLVVLPGFEVEAALEMVERHGVTVLAGVPTMFVAMFDPARRGSRDLSSLRLIDVGGGPVPTSLIQELKDGLGIDTVESYGLTEITTVASVQIPGRQAPLGSCGPVLEGIEVRVRDADGNPVPTGEPGELQFRSDTFMLGYWQQPELTAETLRDGWLRTGDVGRVDGDGNIFILDRIKDMIVSNGYNVFPKEVETVLFAHPGVQAAAVIGQPHAVRGEDVMAFVVPAEGAEPDAEDILAHCREQLARYKVPRGVTFTDALPLTASGKIRRFALRQAPQTATMAATTENSGGQGMSEARQVETAEAEILVDLQDGIGRITMNRPEHRNPLSLDFAALMNAALDRLEDDPDCRVIILTGNGPVFCGGAELGKVVVPGEVDGEWQYLVIRGVNRLVKRLRALDLPVIAAVNGPAVGGGASLALACDIAIAAPTASYYFAFGRVGASGADMGATYLLPRLVGTMRAAHLMLTGADVGAEEGRELGLFTEVVPADQLQATAETMAKQIIEAYPRRAAAMTKMSLFRGESTDLETCLEYEMFAQNYLFRGEEHRERLGAFLNRKK